MTEGSPRTVLWRRAFGKPDGWFPWLRCRLSGHLWTPCEDECCEGRQEWCDRCHAPRFTEEVVWGKG